MGVAVDFFNNFGEAPNSQSIVDGVYYCIVAFQYCTWHKPLVYIKPVEQAAMCTRMVCNHGKGSTGTHQTFLGHVGQVAQGQVGQDRELRQATSHGGLALQSRPPSKATTVTSVRCRPSRAGSRRAGTVERRCRAASRSRARGTA